MRRLLSSRLPARYRLSPVSMGRKNSGISSKARHDSLDKTLSTNCTSSHDNIQPSNFFTQSYDANMQSRAQVPSVVLQPKEQTQRGSGLNPTASTFTPSQAKTSDPASRQPPNFPNQEDEKQPAEPTAPSHVSIESWQARLHGDRRPGAMPDGHKEVDTISFSNDSNSVVTSDDAIRTLELAMRKVHLDARRTPLKERKVPRPDHIVSGPLAPTPTPSYIAQAALPLVRLETPQRLLVILDLNGTLLHRAKRFKQPTEFRERPGVLPLLHYLFEHHTVMIYTSARPENALGMVEKLIPPHQRKRLAAVWARDKLDLTVEQYNEKVQVYKKLEKVWNDVGIQSTAGAGQVWDQSNTVLVDDSHTKALAQPYNLVQVPEFTNDRPATGAAKDLHQQWTDKEIQIMQQLQLKLEELKHTSDASRLIRSWQAGETEVPKVPDQIISTEETVDQKKLKQQPQQGAGPKDPPTQDVPSRSAGDQKRISNKSTNRSTTKKTRTRTRKKPNAEPATTPAVNPPQKLSRRPLGEQSKEVSIPNA